MTLRERLEAAKADDDHATIWLEPKCAGKTPEGRSWCEHDAWDRCECGLRPVQYVRIDDALSIFKGWLEGEAAIQDKTNEG